MSPGLLGDTMMPHVVAAVTHGMPAAVLLAEAFEPSTHTRTSQCALAGVRRGFSDALRASGQVSTAFRAS